MQKNIEKIRFFFQDWKNQKIYLKWMLAQMKPFLGLFLLLLLIDTCASLLVVYESVVAKHLIDGATGDPSGNPQSYLIILAATLLGTIILYAVLDYLSAIVHERYAFAVRLRAFDRVLQSEWGWIASYHSGDMVTRLTSDVDTFANGTATMIPDLLLLIVRLISAFSVLYYYDHMLAIMALLLGPFGAILSVFLGDKMKKYQVALKETESKSLSLMQETVLNIAVVKAFQQEEKCTSWLSGIRDERMHLVKKKSKRNIYVNLSMQFVFTIGYMTAFAWGIYRLSTGSITYGTMSVFLSLAMQIQGPIMSLAKMVPQFINVLASVGRVMEVDGQQPEEPAEACVEPEGVGIRMHDVSFSYLEDQILDSVQFDIRPGDWVGVIGYSGAGKTTLIRLLLGFIHPKEPGQVLFYNASGKEEIASKSARRLIAYVPQGNSLQSGTILENLRAGNAEASIEKIWEALTIADAEDFVRNLPEGLDTAIGERASGLSEGQAQRIAIARAILKDTPVLILDEATSALDERTEAVVLERLSQHDKAKTCVIITHRRAMLEFCNRAFEMTNGQIIEKTIENNELVS